MLVCGDGVVVEMVMMIKSKKENVEATIIFCIFHTNILSKSNPIN